MIQIEPIGYVEAGRVDAEVDYWGGVQSCIRLTDIVDIKPVIRECRSRA